MNYDIDLSRVLYGLGGFLGVIAILYFGRQIILDLSPAIKSFILLGGTAFFIGAGEYVEHKAVTSSFYVFSAFSYISFLIYTVPKFRFNSDQIFLILAFSSALFIALGYMRSGKGYELERDKAKILMVSVAALLALVVAFDVMGAQPEYSLELEESVEVVDREEFQLGVLEVRNDFALSRNIDVPTYRGCLGAGEVEQIYVRPDTEDIIKGNTVKELELTDTVGTRPDSNRTLSGNYSIVEGQCPDNPEEGTIYIYDGEEGERAVEVRR